MAWEHVTGSSGEILERHPVDGGFLYRTTIRDGEAVATAMVFVPHTDKVDRLSEGIVGALGEEETPPKAEPIN